MKRIFSLLLVLCLLGIVLPALVLSVDAAESGTTGDCRWRLDGTVLTISGNGAIAHYRGEAAPWKNRVSEVVIEEGVTAIGDSAFSDCVALQSIQLPSTLREIGHFAFMGCASLKTLEFPEGLKKIGNGIFMGGAGLQEIYIPKSLTEIGTGNFTGLRHLTRITVHSGNTAYCDVDGVLFNKAKTTLYAYPAGSDRTSYTVPTTGTRIESQAFSEAAALAQLEIHDGVSYIGMQVFVGTGALDAAKRASTDGGVYINNHLVAMTRNDLTEYTVRAGTITVGGGAMQGCSRLQTLTLPDGLVFLGENACSAQSSLQSVTLPASIKQIEKFAFYGNSALKTIYYRGTSAQRSKITIGAYNDPLSGATWHTDSCIGSATHPWSEYRLISSESCTEDGSRARSCPVCQSEQTERIPATGHDYSAWVQILPQSCLQQGEQARLCQDCGYTESKTQPALGHDLGVWVTDIHPDCTNAGSEHRSCSRCSYQETREMGAMGHALGEWVQTLEPSCSAVGEESKTCSFCDYAEHRPLPMIEHVYGNWEEDVAAGCTTQGVEKRSCVLCPHTEARNTPQLGHSYGEYATVVAPTTRSEGREEAVCAACGDVQARPLAQKELNMLVVIVPCVAGVLLVALAAVVLITANIRGLYNTLGETVRHAAFTVSTIITTTGYGTTDFDLWPAFSKGIIMFLMIVGACAGSTGGGLKIARLLILMKSLRRNITKVLNPRKVRVVRNNGQVMNETIIENTNAYLAAYILIIIFSYILISLDGFSIGTNLTAVLACFNNIGPGLEAVGPTCNFSGFSDFSKLVLSLDMLAGRLEIFPILLLFSRSTWKR